MYWLSVSVFVLALYNQTFGGLNNILKRDNLFIPFTLYKMASVSILERSGKKCKGTRKWIGVSAIFNFKLIIMTFIACLE